MRKLVLLAMLLLIACVPVTPVPEATPPRATVSSPVIAHVGDSASGYSVSLHPDGPLYAGDQVSFSVIAPADGGGDPYDAQVSFEQRTLGIARFGPYDISGRNQAVLMWAWDTSQLTSGTYALTFSVRPDGPTWTEDISLLPRSDLPAALAGAHWASVSSQCCIISYITGTDAERDISDLEQIADAQAADVSAKMGAGFREKIPVTFLPRTLGQGGFTDRGIYVSYLDRNYAGSTAAIVLHHEMVHWLDAEMGGDQRPTLLVEGLAVYITGGHFKPEPLFPRAAALIESGGYIPLRQLADNFYPSQHETGYLEGAALVGYMVQTYGWQAFNDFYRNIHAAPSGRPSDGIDAALQERFNLTFDQLEQNLLAFLRAQTVDDSARTDLRLSIRLYDDVRLYQQMLDPSAYYLNAWLPNGAEMRQRGIVADYLRHPDSAVNVGIETLLVDADRDLLGGHYAETENILRAVEALLTLVGGRKP